MARPCFGPPSRAAVALTLSLGGFGVSCAGSTATAGVARGSAGSAAMYASRVDTTWAPPPSVTRVYAAARAGGAQATRELVPDAALAALAQAVADRVAMDPQRRSPSVRTIQALAWSAGIIDPVPAVVVTRMVGEAPLDDLTASVADMARDGVYNVVGVGRTRASDGSDIVVVALAQRRVTLNLAVPRQVSVGTRIQVAGRLGEGLRNPELALTHPDGRNEHFPLGEGPDFVGQFPADARGAFQVELLAESEGGSTVIANFPVYAGVEPPRTPDEVAVTASETAAQAESLLLELVNQARREAGRRPLQLMPALSAVARAHSEDMSANHFIAHNSRTSGTPADRLRRANLQSGIVLENLGRGYSAREIHEGLMSSPGHRANIMNERVTHIGIGVAVEHGAGGGLVVTENFIEVASPVDLNAAPAFLLSRLNSARTRRGAAALEVRPQLAEVAGATARAFFEGNVTQQQVVDRANRRVSQFGLIFRRVAVLATVVTRLEDASMLEPLMEPEIGAVGIGVAQGTRRDTPPNAIFVVFVVGYPR
jgi:uncharacterized protein YkwD